MSTLKAGRRGGRGRGPSVSQRGGNTLEDYLHVVTDAEAALLVWAGSPCPFQKIKQKTGADIQFDPYPSPGLDMKLVIIRGSRLQIEAAVRLINQKTGAQKMSEENKEVLVGMSQLQFGQYLGEPCYAPAAAQLPLPASLPPSLPRNWKRGNFDVLLIHRHYGLITCEVKSFGHNVNELKMSQEDVKKNIRKKLKVAVSHLDKAEAMLSHLVSDIAPGLRITKTIAVPNLTALHVQQAIFGGPHLTQDLCRCLGAKDSANITGLCLCSDQLSDPKTPWDVSSDVYRRIPRNKHKFFTLALPVCACPNGTSYLCVELLIASL